MKKKFNEWKIYFNSMNNMRINLSFIIIFLFAALLCPSVIFTEQRSETINTVFWSLSILLLCNAILNFIRMNFSKENSRFSKTLPCSKKIYTKYVSISFEFINSLYLLASLFFWIICSQNGFVSAYSPFIFFMDCILHFVFSAAFPFFAVPASSENNKKRKFAAFDVFWKHGWSLYLFYLVFCRLMAYIAKLVIKNEISFFTVNEVYIIVCAGIVVLSWGVNRLVFNKIYKVL